MRTIISNLIYWPTPFKLENVSLSSLSVLLVNSLTYIASINGKCFASQKGRPHAHAQFFKVLAR